MTRRDVLCFGRDIYLSSHEEQPSRLFTLFYATLEISNQSATLTHHYCCRAMHGHDHCLRHKNIASTIVTPPYLLLLCLFFSMATSSKRPHVTAAWAARAAVGLESGITDEKLAELLPFTIKFVLKQNPLTEVSSVEVLPDKWRAASSLVCTKVCAGLGKHAGVRYARALFDRAVCAGFVHRDGRLACTTINTIIALYSRTKSMKHDNIWDIPACAIKHKGALQ